MRWVDLFMCTEISTFLSLYLFVHFSVLLFFCLLSCYFCFFFFFSSRRRHTRCLSDWSSDVCSSDLRRRHRDRRVAQGGRRPADARADREPRRRRDREGGPPGRDHLRLFHREEREIGRASCRERG